MPQEMLTYRYFARAYNWTPDQVRALDLEAVEWLPIIEGAATEAERQEQAAEERVRNRSH